MSFISAGNTTTTTLLINGDTTGNLVFNTGGANTTALTITNTQAATFANNVTITGTTAHTGNASFSNVTTTGSVGIGTTSPNNYLQVTGAKTNTDAASTGQMVIQDTTAYNSSPKAGIQFSVKYNSSGTYAFGTAIQGFKENSTDGNFGQGLAFITQPNGTSPTESMRIWNGGNVNIGAATSSALRLYVRSATADSSSYCVYYDNSSGTVLGYIASNGSFMTGNAASSPTNNTTGNAANLFVDGSGLLQKATSSLKYKHDVKDAYYGLENLLQLRPVTYKGNNDGDKVFGGLIAEEVDAAGLKEFVVYREDDGTPDGLAYGNMVSLCIKAIQELNAKVEAQAAEIAALKAGA